MIRLIERSPVPASPQRVWAWFATLDDHYRGWHPEHVGWRRLRGAPQGEGSIVCADEWIGRSRLRLRFRVGAVDEPHFFRWDALFPLSLAGVGGWFRIEPAGDGCCELVAEVHLGWSAPLAGGLLDAVLRRVVPLDDLRRHMVEEGQNLARLMARPSG